MQQNENAAQASRQGLHVPQWIVVIGANTGGPQALAEILPKLPAFVPAAFVVIQRMRPGFTRVLAEQLGHTCSLPVCEPEDGQALQSSRIFIAPSGSRLRFESVGDSISPAYRIILEDMRSSPTPQESVTDSAMVSATKIFGANTVGVLLSGLGFDGREGFRAIGAAGGITIAQDEASSIVHDLPASAIQQNLVSDVLPLWNIADRITEVVGGASDAVAA